MSTNHSICQHATADGPVGLRLPGSFLTRPRSLRFDDERYYLLISYLLRCERSAWSIYRRYEKLDALRHFQAKSNHKQAIEALKKLAARNRTPGADNQVQTWVMDVGVAASRLTVSYSPSWLRTPAATILCSRMEKHLLQKYQEAIYLAPQCDISHLQLLADFAATHIRELSAM